MERTNTRYVAELLFITAVQLIALIPLLSAEREGVFTSLSAFALVIVYSIVLGIFLRQGEGNNLAEKAWDTNRRRLGMHIFVIIFLTVAAYIILLREINLFVVFIALEVLASLLPGRVLLYGEELWKASRIAYVLVALISAIFLAVNLFSVSLSAVVWLFSNASGIIFMAAMLAVFGLMVAAFFGKRVGKRDEGHSDGNP